MAMTLTDGRGELYQWDTGRTLTVDDATVTQVHFQNRAYGRTIDVDVNNSVAIIPDEILQKPGDLRVYAFSGTAESGFTKVERVFNIVRRNKPNDYMYTPTEQKSLEGLQKQIGDLSDLKTDAKTDIVAAINETATAGQTLGLTGATVGQVPAVKAVDGNGAPTAWEAVELPIGAYTVNLTMGDDGSITADKTFAEIKAAYDNGKVVDAKFADAIVPLCSISDLDALFTLTDANSNGVYTASLICTPDNVWSMSRNGFDAHTLGISGASVGQIVKIKTVDESGAPTGWEPADMPSGSGGGTDTSLGISGASVGQVPIVNSVDENGVPNGWGAGDLPSGGGDEWRLIDEITIEEAVSHIVFTQDSNGNPINLKKVAISLGNVSNGSKGYEDKALGVRVWIYRTVGSSYPNTQFVLSPYTTGNPFIEGSISKGGWGCIEISVGALVNLTSTFLSAKAYTMSTPPIGSTIRQVALGTANTNSDAYGVATKIRIMGVDA